MGYSVCRLIPTWESHGCDLVKYVLETRLACEGTSIGSTLQKWIEVSLVGDDIMPVSRVPTLFPTYFIFCYFLGLDRFQIQILHSPIRQNNRMPYASSTRISHIAILVPNSGGGLGELNISTPTNSFGYV